MNRNSISKRRRRNRRGRTSRQGMATLEFVIGFPLLLFIFAAIYAVSWAGVNRTKVIQQARYDVWKMRDGEAEHNLETLNRNNNSRPLSIPIPTKTVQSILPGNVDRNNAVERGNMQGEISGEQTQTFGTYSWMGGNRTAEAETGIIYWTWDHEEVNSLNGPQPHAFQVIADMTGLVSNGLGQNGASGITGIFDTPSQ